MTMPYSAAISACTRAAKWQYALAIFASVQVGHIGPTVILCNAALSAAEKGQQWQLALIALNVPRKTKLAPDALSFNAARPEPADKFLAHVLLNEGRDIGLMPWRRVVACSVLFHRCDQVWYSCQCMRPGGIRRSYQFTGHASLLAEKVFSGLHLGFFKGLVNMSCNVI